MGLIHHTLPPPPVLEREDSFESEGDSDKNNDGLICNERGERDVIVCEVITNLADDEIFRHHDDDDDDYTEEEVISKSEPEKSDSLTTLRIETNEFKPGGSDLSTYSTIETTSSEMDNYHSTDKPQLESTNKESSLSFLEKLSMLPVDKNEKNNDGLEENERSGMAVQEKIIKLDNDFFLFPEKVSLPKEEEISKSEPEKSDLLTTLKIETSESKSNDYEWLFFQNKPQFESIEDIENEEHDWLLRFLQEINEIQVIDTKSEEPDRLRVSKEETSQSKPEVSEKLESIELINNFLKIKPEVNDVDKNFTTYVETEKKNIDVTKLTNEDTYNLNTGISQWLFLSNILQPNMQVCLQV
ncbi:hypothetical protein HELRODRAFT_176215 [Helobdella robusta]|uniref:Uncharacterized protein n=1 Tax=Helobdella robusta TaxID=6412 RepID=T1FAB0_HELRO|nr:hypothetical protein HELRODRAFT_176215 [Helobdella robusta]ESN99919.1 hypothetical protein HELRODRAFT_176215 [Helobdella robusta]